MKELEPGVSMEVEDGAIHLYCDNQENLSRYLHTVDPPPEEVVLCMTSPPDVGIHSDVNLKQEQLIWVPRSEAEHDPSMPQIIPYCVIMDSDANFVAYERAGSETRLNGLLSIGWGGHIDLFKDAGDDIKCTIHNCISRELKEELDLDPKEYTAQFMYGYYDTDTPVNSVHFCVGMFCTLLRPFKKKHLSEGKNLRKMPAKQLASPELSKEEFEKWSIVALDFVRQKVLDITPSER